MGLTSNYLWNYGPRGQKPWWNEWQTLWQSVDAELYKRSKDLFMQGYNLYGSDQSAGDLKLYSTSHATKGKIYITDDVVIDQASESFLVKHSTQGEFLKAVYGTEKQVFFPATTVANIAIDGGIYYTATAYGGQLLFQGSMAAGGGKFSIGICPDEINISCLDGGPADQNQDICFYAERNINMGIWPEKALYYPPHFAHREIWAVEATKDFIPFACYVGYPRNGAGENDYCVIQPDFSRLNTAGDSYTTLKIYPKDSLAGASDGYFIRARLQADGFDKFQLRRDGVMFGTINKAGYGNYAMRFSNIAGGVGDPGAIGFQFYSGDFCGLIDCYHTGVAGQGIVALGTFAVGSGIDIFTGTALIRLTGASFVQSVPPSALGDGSIAASQMSFYLDESGNKLKVRTRYSGGGYKTGEVALA